ncbi:TonB-dependent receptor [Novosphingobium sp.]|uniref:TonB-dependent receptor n=1 Tax=Novosphingobium sp. TaxID=1874826 RepID=UPI0026190AC0|nr:TonB-dependent receptor [Novosphingobium sp.]
MGIYNKPIICMTSVVALVTANNAAFAQEVSSDKPLLAGEIVVTATKREQSLQDVPAAISVISGDTMKTLNVTTLKDLARLDPAIQLTTNGVGDNNIIMRGVRSTGAATVALFFDEAVVTGYNTQNPVNGRAPDLGSFDIQRVEVLKGPQGTLFGAGSMAGAMRIIPNRPNFDGVSGNLTSAVQDGSGSNALYEINGFLNVPIVEDKIAARVVGWYTRGGGFIDNITSGRSNIDDLEIRGARVAILLKPTEDFTLTLTGLHQTINVEGAQRFKVNDGNWKNSTRTREPHDEYANLVSAVADFDTGVGNVTAASSYYFRRVFEFVDTTPTAAGIGIPGNFAGSRLQDRGIWSNELRFASKFAGPLQIVAGAFYQKDKNFYETDIIQTQLNGLPPCATKAECDASGLGGLIISARSVDNPIEQWSLFGQADFEIAPKLTLTAGARYFQAKITALELNLQRLRRDPTNLSTVQTTPVVSVNSSDTRSRPDFNFAISYEPSRDLTVYARAASGFRIGGINNAAVAQQFGVTIPNAFSPDSLWSYEAGIKGNLLDGVLGYDLSGYRIVWKGMQVTAFSPTGTFTYITNAGQSVVDGVEASLRVKLEDGFSANLGVAYTNSRLTEDQPAASANASNRGRDGDPTPYVPRWAIGGQLRYDTAINDRWSIYTTVFGNYRSSMATNFNRLTSNYYVMPSYFMADTVIGAKTSDGLDISLFVTNVTNRAAQISIEVSPDGLRAIAPRPRTLGLRLSKNF